MVMTIFVFVLGQKYTFWVNLFKKNCLFKIKLAAWTNSNMLNSMVIFICLALGKFALKNKK